MSEEAKNQNDQQQDQGQQGQQSQQQEKTFTQAELNQVATREKKQGRAAVMRELGLDPEDKDAVKRVKALLDKNKTDEEKAADAVKTATAAQEAAEKRATAAENKLKIVSAGCRSEFIEEVSVLVGAKVNEGTDFDTALNDVKKKCPAWFGVGGDTGTGHGTGHKKNSEDGLGSLGKRLAQSQTITVKNPYFQN